MTKKKRRQLEEEERRRAEEAKAERQQAGASYYGAVNYGEVNGFSVPVVKGQMQGGIQLPPIIQPISLSFLPFAGMDMMMPGTSGNEEDDYDDFDGDDWF